MENMAKNKALETYLREKRKEDILEGIAESVRFVSHLDTSGRSLFDGDKDSPLTPETRDDWVALALTGALAPRDTGDDRLLFIALDTSLPYPLATPGLTQPVGGKVRRLWESPEGIFGTVRTVLRDENPELLADVARQQYERVWPGWTDGLDMVHVVMRAGGSFWAPLITEALERWAGRKVRADGAPYSVRAALQGLLMFGKTGITELSERELMAFIGTSSCPSLPDLITDESVEQAPLLVCGNGTDTVLPSPAEYAAVVRELTGEYMFFHEEAQYGPTDVPDWQDVRFALKRLREKTT